MFDDVQRLIERCIRREEKAWEEFIRRFSGLLFYSAKERLRRGGFSFSHQDVEDIVQHVFTEIWHKGRLEDVRDRKRITAWLSIVAQTRALNYMRKKRERLLGENEINRIDNLVNEDQCIYNNELMERLGSLTQAFEARDKIIFKLCIIYGKTHREIARFMNMPLNTVSTIIARKKKFLQKKLKENGW